MGPIVVLAGGVGAARFLQGVQAAMTVRELTIVGNVGDDTDIAGLHVCPDVDTVLYTLTGQIDEERGRGVRGDSARALERARSLGYDEWFWLGDLDIGLHLARTAWLRSGLRLSEVTQRLGRTLGLADCLLPVSDERLRAIIEPPGGDVERRGLSVHATDMMTRDAKAREHLANVALEVAGIRVGK